MSTEKWKADNREKMQKYRREWYARNREESISTVKKYSVEIVRWFRDYKRTCSCSLCGESRPACLTFHHRDPAKKIIEVSILVTRHNKRERVLSEIAKCDVLCEKCHADLHFSHLCEREEEHSEENLNLLVNETNVLG